MDAQLAHSPNRMAPLHIPERHFRVEQGWTCHYQCPGVDYNESPSRVMCFESLRTGWGGQRMGP